MMICSIIRATSKMDDPFENTIITCITSVIDENNVSTVAQKNVPMFA
jgi:hypothetical protein